MGFLKDLSAIKAQTRQIEATRPRTGDRLKEMNQKMATLNAGMVASTAVAADPGAALAGRVVVLAAAPPVASVSGAPVVELTVLVLAPGRPPVPSSALVPVPATELHRLRVGAALAAWIDPVDLGAFAVDWATTPA